VVVVAAETQNTENLGFTLSFNEIRSLVESEFIIEETRMEFGVITFFVRFTDTPKKSFENLVKKMKPYNLTPMLRERDKDKIALYVVPKPKIKVGRIRTNLILLIVTTITIFLSGYFNSIAWVKTFGGNTFTHAAYFTIALLAIVGLHEIGHKIVCWLKGTEASLPYFIPGPPFPIGFGTFGAVIMQKEPPVNRDELFDLGFSGPVVSFVVSLVVAAISINLMQPVPPELLKETTIMTIPVNLAWALLTHFIRPASEEQLMLMPPIGWAAWLGFVITFLNLLPIWQLDGGHIASALFGVRGRQIASFIGLLVTFATGFWFFGLLIMLLSFHARSVEPLDNVSSVSFGRKVLGVLAYVMLVFSAVVLWS